MSRSINFPQVTPELARSAREHFQYLYADPLTEEDGREIAVNVLGVFRTLQEWKQRQDARVAAGLPAVEPRAVPSVRGPRSRG